MAPFGPMRRLPFHMFQHHVKERNSPQKLGERSFPWGRIAAAALFLFVGYGLGRGALGLAHEAAEVWQSPKISDEAAAFLLLDKEPIPTEKKGEAPPEPVEKQLVKPVFQISDLHRSLEGQNRSLTQKMRWLLDDYEVPEGAVVVLDIHTGDILTAVGRRNGKPDVGAALSAQWPAASIFKMVTTSALLKNGVRPSQKICFNGGLRRVTQRQLDQRKGARCSTLIRAFGKSQNVPFARWTDQKLNAQTLTKETLIWGFGAENRFQLPKGAAGAPEIPQTRLAFAQTGAGFGNVPLSPLHAAMMAAGVANQGEVPLPKISAVKPPNHISVMSANHAKILKKAMIETVKKGSARRAFLERRRPAMGRLGAGGKTGSLFIQSAAGQDLSWFVGFAPAEKPEVAVAAYVINGPKWRIRAPYMGREALRAALLRTSPYRPTQDPLLVQRKVQKRSAAR